ncbi:MAG: RNA polymerase sigma factor, partial [Actinobacteria bacterium]
MRRAGPTTSRCAGVPRVPCGRTSWRGPRHRAPRTPPTYRGTSRTPSDRVPRTIRGSRAWVAPFDPGTQIPRLCPCGPRTVRAVSRTVAWGSMMTAGGDGLEPSLFFMVEAPVHSLGGCLFHRRSAHAEVETCRRDTVRCDRRSRLRSMLGVRGVSLRGFALRRLSDEALLEHACSGQEVAFAELYRRFHALVHGFALARLLDVQAAEDVTQETFLRIARAGAPDGGIRSARAWVMTVARHTVVDHVRRQKRLPDAVPVDVLPDSAASESAADTALGREDAKTVFLALARMRTRYRSALVLREMHGLSSHEIGETMGLKPGAVDTLL